MDAHVGVPTQRKTPSSFHYYDSSSSSAEEEGGGDGSPRGRGKAKKALRLLNDLASAAGERLRAARIMIAPNDDDSDNYISSYIASGVPSSRSSSWKDDRRISSESKSSLSSSSGAAPRRRRPPPPPPPLHPRDDVRRIDPPPRPSAPRRGGASRGGASGPSSSRGHGGGGGGRRRRRGGALDDDDDHLDSDGNDDDAMGRRGDGRLEEYFYWHHIAGESTNAVRDRRRQPERRGHPGQQRRHPPPPPPPRDGRREQRERPMRDPKRNVVDGVVRVENYRPYRPPREEIPRRPRRAERVAGGDGRTSSRGGRRTRHVAAACGTGGHDVSLRGAVPTITPHDYDVAAYQWDRKPVEESSAPRERESAAAAHQLLAAVAYQWDRIPVVVPTGSSEIEGPNPEESDERTQIPHGTDIGKQIGGRDDLGKIFRLLTEKTKTEKETKSWQVEESRHDSVLDTTERLTNEIQNGLSSNAESEENLKYDMGPQFKENSVRSMDISPTHESWTQEKNTQKRSKYLHTSESQPSIKELIPPTSHARAEHIDLNSSPDFGSLSKSADIKAKASSALGLLSMEDLLRSITKEIAMSQKGTIRTREGSHDKETSVSQLDSRLFNEGNDSTENETLPFPVRNLGFDRDKSAVDVRSSSSAMNDEDRETRMTSDGTTSTTNLYEVEYGSDEESEEEEEQKPQLNNMLDALSAAPAPPPLSTEHSDAPSSISPRIGNAVGLMIDLSSLQASKPSGGLRIDLHSLQAYKPSKKPEANTDETSQPEKPAFHVNNLPFTGRFGESGMYTGLVSEQYKPHGRGTMEYDNGEVIKGYWSEGDLVRESELYSDSEEDDDDESDDLSSSMANIQARGSVARFGRDCSRSRSRSEDRDASTPPPPSPLPPSKVLLPPPLPPPPEYNIGDPGRHRDMVVDKDEALLTIEQLRFGDGAFIRRSDGKWTYAVVKSLEETAEGKSAIRFTVNDENSSKSYSKKYWRTHVRPLKGTKPKPPPPLTAEDREGRAKQREPAVEKLPQKNAHNDSNDEIDRGYSCPPTQSRLAFVLPARHGGSRSHSRQRSVSASPMRTLTSIVEIEAEDENEDER